MEKDITIKAKNFAQEAHKHQLDDTGKPYFLHVKKVAEILSLITKDKDIIAAGYLHDTIEDCGANYCELRETFNEKIADLVLEVTHDDLGKKGCIFPRLKTREAVLIKFADRLSNLSRMEGWDEERRIHYSRRSKFWKSSEDDKIIEGQKKS